MTRSWSHGRMAAGLLLAAAPLLATIVPRLSFEAMVDSSVQVVHGRVSGVSTNWDQRKQFLWTHYELEVVETWKGAKAARITVSEPGGTYEGRTMRIVGTPVYQVGDEVVVFLEQTPIGLRRTMGWGQGRFIVERGRDGAAQVRPGMGDIQLTAVAGRGDGTLAGQTPMESIGGMRLDEFRQRVKSMLRQGGAEVTQ